MRYTVRLIVMLLFCACAASAQWRPVQPYFMRYYGLRSDSALMIPRDTTGPAGDSALIGYKDRKLWVKTGIGWEKVGSDPDPALVRALFSAGTGLTYNSSTGAFAANFGTTAGTVMQGNDSRVTGAVPNTRTIAAGTGLTGGGDLTANRSFAIDPAYASFTNYYTKTNLQTSGQAAVHWGNLTNVPGAFPTTSNLQTVLGNGNTATNSITLGVNGNSTAYLYNVIRRISSTDYTSTVTTGVPPGGGAAAQLAISDGTTTKSLYVRHADAAPTYTPDGTNLYTLWHSNNHPAGSAFTPTLTGANVLSSLTVNSAGHVSALTTRTLTSGDIGAVPAGTVTTSYSDMLGSLTPRFITAVTGAPSSGTWYGIHMPGDASNSAQIAFKAGSGFFRTYDAGVASPWLQFADRSWVTSNFAASSGSGNYIQNQTSSLQTGANFWINSGRVNNYFQVSKDGSNTVGGAYTLYNAALTRGVQLQLNGDANPGLATWIHNGSTWVKRQEYFSNGTTQFYGNLTVPTVAAPSGSDLSLSAPASHSLFFNPGGTNRGVWDGDGRLGIGTVPNSLRASMLEVNGNVWSTDAYLLGTGSVPVAEFFLSGSDAGLRTMSTQNFVFNTNADTERMRIDGTSGNILVNTTSDNGVNKLQVNGSISSTGQLVNGWLTVTGDASLGNENVAINTLGQITTNGTIEAGGSITTSTDLNAVGAVNAGGKVSGQHFKGGATPSVTKGALVTGSASVSGNDVAGTVTVTVTTGTSLSTNSEFFTLNFGVAYTSTPRVVFSPASATTATLQCYVKNAGTGSFQIATAPSLSTVVTTYVWNYHVIE